MNHINQLRRGSVFLWSALMLPFAIAGLTCGCGSTFESQHIPPPIKPLLNVIDAATMPITVPLALTQADEPFLLNVPKRPKPGDKPPPGGVLIYKAGDPTVSNRAPKSLQP